MFKKTYKKIFQEEHNEYERIRTKHIEAQIQYDDEHYSTDETLLISEIKNKLHDIENEENLFIESYAERVFKILSNDKPTLIKRSDKSVVEWKDAFGEDFTKLSFGLKCSLVALIECDGGQYELKR